MSELSRYLRQIAFAELGEDGQRRLLGAKVLLVGCGALGSAIAISLVRAGIGFLRIVDGDIPELVNLHRQFLFDEEDVSKRIPKALVAKEKLARMNSSVRIEALVAELYADNIEKLAKDVDLILDGTDNLETRYLINDFSVKSRIPWIYGAVIGASGMVLPIIPGKTPCLRCLFPNPPKAGEIPSCETEGVLNPAPIVVSGIEVIEAIKLLSQKGEPLKGVLGFNLWEESFTCVELKINPKCRACQEKKFEFLEKKRTDWSFRLCGRNAVQISPAQKIELDLASLKERLEKVGKVRDNGYLLEAELEGYRIVLFPDSRAIIYGTTDEARARSLYNRYLGR